MMLCDAAQVADGKLFILGGGWSLIGPGSDAFGDCDQGGRRLERGGPAPSLGALPRRRGRATRSSSRVPTAPSRSRCEATSRWHVRTAFRKGVLSTWPWPSTSARSLSRTAPGSPGASRLTATARTTGSSPSRRGRRGSRPRNDDLRPAVRPCVRGLRRGRRVSPLAGQDDHRVRRPPLLPPDDESSSAPPRRLVRGARDSAGIERRRRQSRLLARTRDERARRLRFRDRRISRSSRSSTGSRRSTGTRSTPRPESSRLWRPGPRTTAA